MTSGPSWRDLDDASQELLMRLLARRLEKVRAAQEDAGTAGEAVSAD